MDSNKSSPLFSLSRRAALKTFGLSAAWLYLPGCRNLFASKNEVSSSNRLAAISPIDRTMPSPAPAVFSGDNPDRSHAILWNKIEYLSKKGGVPKPTEIASVVVVGGGMSGLMSAYLLRDHHPIVLERAERLGGNSRGESWNGIDYSIGAAYFGAPDEGSELDHLYKELGLMDFCRLKSGEDPVTWNGKRYAEFWTGETVDPKHREQFKKFRKYLETTPFPEIPAHKEAGRRKLDELDRETFLAHIERVIGEKLHPHLETNLEHFFWSAFGGSMAEVSAASGLNFCIGEIGDLLIPQGGNSAIAERVVQKILETGESAQLRPSSVVVDVQAHGDHCIVAYENEKGELVSIQAKTVIMACPKFVANVLIDGLEPERVEAIGKLKYNSYLVANVMLNKTLPDDFYDMYMLGKGSTDLKDIKKSSEEQKTTDFIHAAYAHQNATHCVLTLYRPFPYPGVRRNILSPTAYETYRQEFHKEIVEEILPLVGCTEKDVAEVRLARWGHPIPVATKGLISGKIVDQVQKPYRDRVFFVEQDNWCVPAFETAAGEALIWTKKVRALLS